jgi:hypothetical protein
MPTERTPARKLARPSGSATRGAAALLALSVAMGSLLSCGASIRAMYESDVRFEHCMALDASPGVKPTLQRGCWDEWLSFYTFGQTRDRIDYAHARRKALGSESDFDEGDAPRKVAAQTAPDPTSALAPPPSTMTTVDGGLPTVPADAERDAARLRCAADCDVSREACRLTCRRTAACEQACAARQARCSTRCDRAQGR